MRHTLTVWYRAIRPFTLSASVVPVLVGSMLATHYGPLHWTTFALVLLASMLVQSATNLVDEYADHHQEAATHKVQAPYKVIALGLLTPAAVKRGALTCFVLAALIGMYLVSRTSWLLALICLASAGVAYGYSAGPKPLGHLGLGEPLVFVFMGPVMVLGSFYVQTQFLTWSALWLSLPVGCLVTNILVVNNLRDMEEDRHSGKLSLALLYGRKTATRLYSAFLGVAFGSLVALVCSGVGSWLWLLPLLIAPQAWQLMRLVRQGTERSVLHHALRGSAQLHLRFGILLALALSPLFAWVA